jgi:hypothetical protein
VLPGWLVDLGMNETEWDGSAPSANLSRDSVCPVGDLYAAMLLCKSLASKVTSLRRAP